MSIRGRTILGVLVFWGCVVLGIGLDGGSYYLFVDYPSFLIVAGCVAGAVLARHSLGDIASFGDDVVDTLITSSVGSGILGTLIGLVQMLANMSDPSAIGPAMAIALLTEFYGIGLALMFYLMKSSVRTNKILAVSLLVIPVILLVFFVLLLGISK